MGALEARMQALLREVRRRGVRGGGEGADPRDDPRRPLRGRRVGTVRGLRDGGGAGVLGAGGFCCSGVGVVAGG